jgi:hypothetical protein
VVEHHGGGIFALFNILKDHWGAVERDLQSCGYTINDVITERMPLSGFVHFVVYAPVGTAVFHMLNEGWTADTHQLTTLIDVANALFWSKTQDAQEKNPRHKPKPQPRPGWAKDVAEPEVPEMTIEDYLRLAGGEGAVNG